MPDMLLQLAPMVVTTYPTMGQVVTFQMHLKFHV